MWDVGARPEGSWSDLPLRGSALAQPLFLPMVLIGAAATARQQGWSGMVGTAMCALVGAAFLAGSTLNLPTDLAAARAARASVPLTIGLAAIHTVLVVALLWHSLPSLAAGVRR